MENINEVDFEIVKEFINLPLDSLKQFFEHTMGAECNIMLSEAVMVDAVDAEVKDGSIGIDVECSGGVNGHLMYFFSYDDSDKYAMIKNKAEYDNTADDDKYELAMNSVRQLVLDASLNLADTYRMLTECEINVANAEGFSVSRAADFYASTFEDGEQVVLTNGTLSFGDGQKIAFKQLISVELAKSIVEMFYNSDIQMPNSTSTLGDNFPNEPVESASDDFAVGNIDMNNFINSEIDNMRPDDQITFTNDLSSIVAPVHTETPISESVEHISAPKGKGNLDLIMSVPVEVSVEVGRTKKRIKEILDFKKGTLVELDRVAGEPMDIFVNGKCIAKGEVVVIDDKFGVRITKIMKTNDIFN